MKLKTWDWGHGIRECARTGAGRDRLQATRISSHALFQATRFGFSSPGSGVASSGSASQML